MQITRINSYNSSVYKNNRNNSVNFKSAKEELVSPKVMNMMKGSIRNLVCFSELNSVNKYVVPDVQKRVSTYPLSPALQIIKVPSKQLSELLGARGNDFKLSLLEGQCVVVTDKDDSPENCDYIYETTVCLVPDPIPNPSLYELLFK